MNSDWPLRKLGDITRSLNAKRVPVSSLERQKRQGSYRYYGASGVVDYIDDFIFDGTYLLISEDGENLRTRNTPIAFKVSGKYWVNNHAHILEETEPGIIDFLEHAFRHLDISAYITGAVQPKLNKRSLEQIELRVPDLEERYKINNLLGSLDDKIELNWRMNETLEKMARALFRDWFIDFGPTRRQMDGATDPAAIMGHAFPNDKAAALAPLFPAQLGGDGLPEGWKMGTLKDYGIVKNGFAFKSKDWRDMGVPVLKIKNVKPRLVSLDGCGFIDIGLARKKSNFQLQSGDILVGMTGYVGEVGRVPETKPLPMLNQRVGHIKAKYLEGFSPFMFSCTRQPEFKEHAVARSHGSAQANVSTKDLELFGVVIAGKTIVAAYDQFAMPIFDYMQLADTENQTLAQMRDLLLPKLMSGEIQLNDAPIVQDTLDGAAQIFIMPAEIEKENRRKKEK